MSSYDDDVVVDTDVATILTRWKADLIDRLARARLIFELADTNIDTTELEVEAERFLRCARIVSWIERQAP